MKRISKFLFIAALLLGLVTNYSCTKDFEEMNTDPNSPSLDQAAPDMLLTNAIESMTDRVHEIFLGHEMGSCWAQHMAKCQYTDEDRYIFRPSVVNNSWRSFFAASGKDIYTIQSIASGKLNGQDSAYYAVATVLQCYVSSVLTDLFGPIPYTEAWQGDQGNTLPKYDDQESIYRDMISKLAEANNLLNPETGSIGGDILFNNDIMKWKKFANSLRVRLLMRMSGRDEAFVTTELTAMIANGNPMFESNDDNAALQYLGSAPNNNPINENRKTRDDHRVSANIIDLLNNKYFDYRVMVFAMPDGNDAFEGMPNGLTSADAAAFNGNGIANTSKLGEYFTQATAPGQLMSYAELHFFLAEAALKGYIPGGAAQAKVHYDAGVVASFTQWGDWLQGIFDAHSDDAYGGLSIPAGYTVADEYTWHTTDPAAPAYFDETAGTDVLLQLIAEQKYIATFDQGLQSWFEWRRLGYPVLTPAAAGVIPTVPVRVPYPSDEFATNPGAVAAGVTLLGGTDDLTTRVWWDVTP